MYPVFNNRHSLTFYQIYNNESQTDSFKVNSYDFFMKPISNISYNTVNYTQNVNQGFTNLKDSLISRGLKYAKNPISSRGGYMAENFVADTYNLDAVIKKVDVPKAIVPEDNKLNSVDIKYGEDEASLKFYKEPKGSVGSQENPGYKNQKRIIPSDQLEKAKRILENDIKKDMVKGRTESAKYKEKVKVLLDDKIRGEKGVESMPLTKKESEILAKTIKTDKQGNGYVDKEKFNKFLKDKAISKKVYKSIFKNELRGIGLAAAIGAGIGFTLGFAVTLAQSGVTPETVTYAMGEGVKSGFSAGVQSLISYGIVRTIGQFAIQTLQGAISNFGVAITENISEICAIGVGGLITIAVFSTYQFIKLVHNGVAVKEALLQVGKQALFSLSLLILTISAQAILGGPAGIIVSISTGIIFIAYSIGNILYKKELSEKLKTFVIDNYEPVFLQ